MDPSFTWWNLTDLQLYSCSRVAMEWTWTIFYFYRYVIISFCFQKDDGDEELCSVYVPTNHLYIGDIFLVNSNEIIRPNLSIREGIGLFSPLLHACSLMWRGPYTVAFEKSWMQVGCLFCQEAYLIIVFFFFSHILYRNYCVGGNDNAPSDFSDREDTL
ncbi:hypothetical protein SAY86_003474 [Trapa natans]|uniref:Uncharacterized protein n=1 Tax=Trapa natans TaxID=22666 RepID=A0AAN7RGY7_TRANT|nr:hypothetical protein SAY86_003474 [Trapa natans]